MLKPIVFRDLAEIVRRVLDHREDTFETVTHGDGTPPASGAAGSPPQQG